MVFCCCGFFPCLVFRGYFLFPHWKISLIRSMLKHILKSECISTSHWEKKKNYADVSVFTWMTLLWCFQHSSLQSYPAKTGSFLKDMLSLGLCFLALPVCMYLIMYRWVHDESECTWLCIDGCKLFGNVGYVSYKFIVLAS